MSRFKLDAAKLCYIKMLSHLQHDSDGLSNNRGNNMEQNIIVHVFTREASADDKSHQKLKKYFKKNDKIVEFMTTFGTTMRNAFE